ncbi:hypothetical protein T484DRAFT_1944924 [Baffinella frigidus]|nr:hypothetical protein T484DRAFT_1944924 [Cryptophyta sp. CCMP2293]
MFLLLAQPGPVCRGGNSSRVSSRVSSGAACPVGTGIVDSCHASGVERAVRKMRGTGRCAGRLGDRSNGQTAITNHTFSRHSGDASRDVRSFSRGPLSPSGGADPFLFWWAGPRLRVHGPRPRHRCLLPLQDLRWLVRQGMSLFILLLPSSPSPPPCSNASGIEGGVRRQPLELGGRCPGPASQPVGKGGERRRGRVRSGGWWCGLPTGSGHGASSRWSKGVMVAAAG